MKSKQDSASALLLLFAQSRHTVGMQHGQNVITDDFAMCNAILRTNHRSLRRLQKQACTRSLYPLLLQHKP